jgi:hypothetical protein
LDKAGLKIKAPSPDEFVEFAKERLGGESARGSKFGPKRAAKMMFCIDEAILDEHRRDMQGPLTACVSQDARGTTLSVRVSVVARRRDPAALSTVSLFGSF